jgi:hypothetical protein
MSHAAVRALVLLMGCVILLAALYVQPAVTFFSGIAIHALAVCIPCSLGFMLTDLEVNSFKDFLTAVAVLSFGAVMAGMLTSIMLSAGVVFVVLSILFILGMTYWS